MTAPLNDDDRAELERWRAIDSSWADGISTRDAIAIYRRWKRALEDANGHTLGPDRTGTGGGP